MSLSAEQHNQLLRPLNATRVLDRKGGGGKMLNYLTQHDVRATLIRMFGFGNFDVITHQSEVLYATERESESGKTQWVVGVRALVEVYIHATDARYSDVATAENINPSRGEATDQAMKSAASDAMKRACVNLGDQFGLSLYDDGSIAPVVKGTLVHPEGGFPTLAELRKATKEIEPPPEDVAAKAEADAAATAAEGSQDDTPDPAWGSEPGPVDGDDIRKT